MNPPSSAARYPTTSRPHEHPPYGHHPTPAGQDSNTRADIVPRTFGYMHMNDFNDSPALGSALSHPSGSFLTPHAFPYSPVDVNGMPTQTPHTRLSVDPALAGTSSASSHQGGSPIYLHPVNYGPTDYFGGLQPCYPPYNNDDWSALQFDPTFNPTPQHSNSTLPEPWGFETFEPSPPSNMQMSPVSVDESPYAASSESSSNSRAVICQWGQKCGATLDDLTAAGIARHLKEYHVHVWDNRSRGRCEWHGSPCTNTTMFYASFGKHIASVHLGATARPCEKCGETFARADTLDRHMKLYCRLRCK